MFHCIFLTVRTTLLLFSVGVRSRKVARPRSQSQICPGLPMSTVSSHQLNVFYTCLLMGFSHCHEGLLMHDYLFGFFWFCRWGLSVALVVLKNSRPGWPQAQIHPPASPKCWDFGPILQIRTGTQELRMLPASQWSPEAV